MPGWADCNHHNHHLPGSAQPEEMIKTIVTTVLIEAVIIIGYAQFRKKPALQLLFSGTLANLFTQAFLWIGLSFSPFPYLPTLLVMELIIVGIEAFILYVYGKNNLSQKEAFILSFCMNLASFSLGWFLPV